DKAAIDALKTNIAKLGAKGADVRPASVLTLGPAVKPLDLILMDPPYGTSAGSVALDKLARLGWTSPATWVSIETAKDETPEIAGFTAESSRVHGKARITLLRAS
ncbi:MAG: 16S rRNA (guanine(966)-N(2))-methyltransferase RsmD, partial [Sphingomonadales bacterium]